MVDWLTRVGVRSRNLEVNKYTVNKYVLYLVNNLVLNYLWKKSTSKAKQHVSIMNKTED